ncbi:MAG: TetR/AcrR family transcriptional regulator [Atribacterota bacterium]|nr:TetR/AcrR family transcriptional regulator [Atribacterota bacterium]
MAIIYSQFHSLESEKQERIINAALKEFARNGYGKASTNEIIKQAGISKGSLFNYFNNKKELYLFLLDYVEKVIKKIYAEVDWNEPDFFTRIRQLGLVKFKIYKKFPHAFNFLKAVSHEYAADVKPAISKLKQDLIASGLEKGYQNIDWSKFREDIDREKMINIINWTMLSFAEQHMNELDSIEDVGREILSESDEYFEILKQCFYKKGEQ